MPQVLVFFLLVFTGLGCLPNQLDHKPITRDAINDLLRQQAKSESTAAKRVSGQSWHGAPLIPFNSTFWRALHASERVDSRIIVLGTQAIPHLLDALADDRTPDPSRIAAAEVLSFFDDPRILTAYESALRNTGLPWGRLHFCLQRHTPEYFSDDLSPAVFGGREQALRFIAMHSKQGYESAMLELLDRQIRAFERGAIGPYDMTRISLRWLNRVYGRDFDDVIRHENSRLEHFRNRELRNGYDPAVVFAYFGDQGTPPQADEPGIASAYANHGERESCRQLIRLLDGSRLDPPVLREHAWKAEFLAWYRSNQGRFQYDYERHRFVIPDPSSQRADEKPGTSGQP